MNYSLTLPTWLIPYSEFYAMPGYVYVVFVVSSCQISTDCKSIDITNCSIVWLEL